MKKRHKVSVALVAAIVAAIALSSAALAATNAFGILDFFKKSPVAPLDSASELVQTRSDQVQSDSVRMTVNEVLYDGSSFSLLAHAEAVDPNANALFGEWSTMDDIPAQFIKREDGSYASSDGKNVITIGHPHVYMMDGKKKQVLAGTIEQTRNDDGSITYFLTGEAPEGAPDKLEIQVGIQIYQADGSTLTLEGVPMTVEKAGASRAVTLIPENTGGRYEIVSASITYTGLHGVLDVYYTYQPEEGEEMGIRIKLLDENKVRYAEGGGWGNGITQETREDGTVVYHQSSTVQSLAEIPSVMYLEAKVIGEDIKLEPIKCTVEAAK